VRVAVNQGREWVFEADIRDCFGTIDHDALIGQLARRVVDRSMLKLIRAWLRMGILECGVTSPTGAGTPQGSPISPLLANIALHVLDEAWQHEGRRLGTLVRYCDDFVVLSPTGYRAEQARELAAKVLERLGMRLHPDKSGIICLTGGRQGFDFLGFHHRKVESWKWRGKFYLQRWPSARAMGVLRDKVRAAISRSKAERPVSAVVADLNPVLRGWGAYFRHGNSGRKFNAVDGYVHERLAILASRKHGLTGRNWTTRFTYGWITRLGVYRLTGTVRGATVHASR
jgi:group II intron reverse transcriptase/maturase